MVAVLLEVNTYALIQVCALLYECSHITVVNTDSSVMDCLEPDTACIYCIPLLSEFSLTIIYILEAF